MQSQVAFGEHDDDAYAERIEAVAMRGNDSSTHGFSGRDALAFQEIRIVQARAVAAIELHEQLSS
jgi:hypothetical protein